MRKTIIKIIVNEVARSGLRSDTRLLSCKLIRGRNVNCIRFVGYMIIVTNNNNKALQRIIAIM